MCQISSTLAQHEVEVTPTDCYACKTHDLETNPITIALSGLSPPENKGPGSGLSTIFSFFIAQPPNCSCPNRAAMMDVWGAEKCLEYLPTVLGWLRESALDNNYPYNEWVISTLLKLYLKSFSIKT